MKQSKTLEKKIRKVFEGESFELLHTTDKMRSDAILNYFRTHPFVGPSLVAKAIGYDAGSLSKLINQTGRLKNIPLAHLESFESVLKDYGYKSQSLG